MLCSVLILDFTLGPSGLSLTELWNTLISPEIADAGTRVIVWDIRLPYSLMAVVVGMSLGLAGAEMQTILNNPLASPFTLGVSSAAAFGAALAIVLGIGIPGFLLSGLFQLMRLFSHYWQRCYWTLSHVGCEFLPLELFSLA